MSYEDDVQIDESALDVMWLDQPALMAKYCKISAEAGRVMNLAKERLDFVESTLSRAIRAEPGAYDVYPGPRGITEDSIKAAIQTHDDYRQASRKYIDAKYENDVAQGVVRSMDQRKSALENLVRLFGQQYFAGPSVPRDLSAERQRHDMDANVQNRMSERIRDRRVSDAPYVSESPRADKDGNRIRTPEEAGMKPRVQRRRTE